jgi:hypothetical protein
MNNSWALWSAMWWWHFGFGLALLELIMLMVGSMECYTFLPGREMNDFPQGKLNIHSQKGNVVAVRQIKTKEEIQ